MKKWAAKWAAHGLSMGILPCNLGCPLLTYIETVGSSVGNSVGSPLLSSTEIVGSSVGSPLTCVLLNLKWNPSLIHMQDICSTCVFNACYSSWSQIRIHKTNRMNIMHSEYCTTWHSYIETYKMACFDTSFILYNGICGNKANSDCI